MACKHFHVVSSYVVNDSTSEVVLQFSTAATPEDTDRFCFKTVVSLPASVANYTVLATVNGGNVSVLNKYGNIMKGKDITTCKVFKGWYGSNLPQVLVTNYPRTMNAGCGNVL